jgi:HD-GYP domain-containing protein (c-di-GMP phosphodiesterase class II)
VLSSELSFTLDQKRYWTIHRMDNQGQACLVALELLPYCSISYGVTPEHRIAKLTSILDVAKAMAIEHELDPLLRLVVREATKVVDAEGASLFITDHGLGQIRLRVASGMEEVQEIVLPLGVGIAGHVASSGQIINIPDAYADDRFYRDVDRRTGRRTRNLLCVPMRSPRNEVVGVIQALNKRAGAFSDEDEELLLALAGQAAAALTNARLYEEIQRLFDGFVQASVAAIESRDPCTAGHSERVARLCLCLLDALERAGRPPWAGLRFSADQRMELRYAALLHDFGKVGVHERVLLKADKLYPEELERIVARVAYAKKSLEAQSLRRRIDLLLRHAEADALEAEEQRLAAEHAAMDQALELVRACNRPSVLPEGCSERLAGLAHLTCPGPDGVPLPLLTTAEVACLSIPRGSLSPEEIREIRSHVTHTQRFLSLIPWTRGLRRVPAIAAGHHEKLDGSGYPAGLSGEQVGLEARIMAIADIYDALTAADRPYKKAVPHPAALRILREEVRRGQLDPELFRLFEEEEVPAAAFGRDALLHGSKSWPMR